MSQITCQNVYLGYEGKTVCEKVNFYTEKGDYLCIIGDNGSGKSTLMKAILGLKPPISGTLALDKSIGKSSVGYMPQQNESQIDFPASVGEVVLSGCIGKDDFRFFPSKSAKSRAQDAMKKLGIDSLENTPYSTLSGGQRQRTLLSRALCAAEKILLLDEPTAGLDPSATAELYDTISRLNKEQGLTVIMITHDLSAVVKYAKKVLHMSYVPKFYPTLEEYLSSSDFPRSGGENNA